MKKFITSLCLLTLAGCATQAPPPDTDSESYRANFLKLNRDYLDSSNTANRLIQTTAQSLREMQDKGGKFPARATFFDLQEMNGKRDYQDSNYHIHNVFLTVTYRPNSFYGSNTRTYTPFCPVFYDRNKKSEIQDYINQVNKIYPVDLPELAQYLALSSLSICSALNRNYQAKQIQHSETQNLILGDKFAIAVLAYQNKREMVDLIINHNDTLHGKHLINQAELKNFYQKINVILKNKKDYSLYELWLLTYKTTE